MSKYIANLLLSAACFVPSILHAQLVAPLGYGAGSKVSYVRTWEAIKPDTSRASFTMSASFVTAKVTTLYVDGLGRPLQTVAKRGSLVSPSTYSDLVMPVVYDGYSRERVKYPAFAANSTGGNASVIDGFFKLNPFQQDSTFSRAAYNGQGDSYYYGQTNFESSPLGRPVLQMSGGSNWVGANRGLGNNYWLNKLTDSVKIWTVTDVVNALGTYAVTGAYDAGQLDKSVQVDEHGKQMITFTDKEGNVILRKMQMTAVADNGTGSGHVGWLCTYYLYDALNRLRCVIQPKGTLMLATSIWSVTSDILNEQCFRYEYDVKSRMNRKKVPGSGEMWMVYDARDRVVMTQDAVLRGTSQKKWLYTQYDSLNRIEATGTITDAANYNNLAYHTTRADTSIFILSCLPMHRRN